MQATPLSSLFLLAFVLLAPHVAMAQSQAEDLQKLRDAGYPEIDRPWRGPDYIKAATIVRGEVMRARFDVPMLGDTHGGLLLRRLAARENLAYYKDLKLPFEERGRDFMELGQSLDAIVQVYTALAKKGFPLNREIAGLTAYTLHLSSISCDVLREMEQLAKKNANGADVPPLGDARSKCGPLADVYTNVFGLLQTSDYFTPQDVSLILSAVQEHMAQTREEFLPEFRAECQKKVQELRAKYPDAELSAKFDEVIKGFGP